MENFSPNFWSDILLDGPGRAAQIEGMKRLVRDAGRAGIPVIGYNFSLAGVWGWQRRPLGARRRHDRGLSTSAPSTPTARSPTAWSGTCATATREPARRRSPSTDAELWDRLARFLERTRAGRRGGRRAARRASRRPAGGRAARHRAARQRRREIRPAAGARASPANALEFCIGSLAEMPEGDIYETTRPLRPPGRIAYVHFRNVRGRVPRYVETFVDDGDVDMAEIVRILREEGFDGVLVPDHVPELDCPAPWHAGHAYTVGYMRALVAQSRGVGRADAARRREDRPRATQATEIRRPPQPDAERQRGGKR